MYIDVFEQILIEQDACQWENEKYKILWDGFVFVTGILSGEDSIQAFVKKMEEKDIKKAHSLLRGNFACIVYNKNTKTFYAFVDNSRQSYLYYSDNAISTSFLELVSRQNISADTLNPQCAVEFILTGHVFTQEIFFENVKIIGADEILVLSENRIIVQQKEMDDIFALSLPPTKPETFLEAFNKIVPSLRNNKISIDLTGGTDSRTVAVIMNHFGLEFETAVCGVTGYSDVEISKKIGKILGFNNNITYHSVKETNVETDLDNLFRINDGLSDIIGSHRLYQLQQHRKERNIDLFIGASGGELYKDGGYWRAAFGAKNNVATIKNMVASGIAGWGLGTTSSHNLFSESCRKHSLEYRNCLTNRLIENFNDESKYDKYKIADKIFYEYSARAPRGSGNNMINSYIPFLDENFVVLGINLPWKKRLFHNCYRDVLTSINHKAARFPTNRGGTSISSEFRFFTRDFLKFLLYPIKRKICRKREIGNDQELYKQVRGLEETKKLVVLLKTSGILHADLQLDDISDVYLGRIFTLGKMIKFVKEN